jgi:hypothetical protein
VRPRGTAARDLSADEIEQAEVFDHLFGWDG